MMTDTAGWLMPGSFLAPVRGRAGSIGDPTLRGQAPIAESEKRAADRFLASGSSAAIIPPRRSSIVMSVPMLPRGKRVRVTHQIEERDRVTAANIEGIVESVEARPTGSWFARGKNDRLWLPRLLLRKDDGELILVNIDPQTRIVSLD